MSEEQVTSKVKWIQIDSGQARVTPHEKHTSCATYIMEVAGGCLVKEIAVKSSHGAAPGVAMTFIIGARLSDFIEEPQDPSPT